MSCRPCRILREKLGLGRLARAIQARICNLRYPEYNLYNALALKSGPPGTPVFKFTTDGNEVSLFPFGQHLDQRGQEISDLKSLKLDFEKPKGKIEWITEYRLYQGKYLTEFVKEGPVRIHYLPGAKCLAAGGGRNRILTLMWLGFTNAKQLKEARWDEANQKYVDGDIAINLPGEPVWDDIPPGVDKQGWVDKTKRWEDAWRQGLKFTLGDVFQLLFGKP